MANRKIGAIIALDGEQKFKSAVSACTKELNTMKSALKLVEAQTEGQANSLQAMEKRQSALNDVLEATKKRQADVEAALKHAEDDYERVGKQVEVYQRTLEKAQKKLAEMKESGEATDDELQKQEKLVKDLSTVVERGSNAYEKGGARIQDWKKNLNDAKTETVNAERAVKDNAEAMKNLDNYTDKAADELDDFAKEAGEAAKETDELDISLKSMIKNSAVNVAVDAMRAIGDKAVEAAKYVVDVGSNFEAAMSKVGAISGATGTELEALTTKAEEMGRTTKFSASESADAFSYMAMAGWKTEEMLEGIDGIMALAAASGEDLATTSDIVTDALTAFGLSAEDSGKMADVLAATSANANTNVSMLGESFKYAAPVVGALGGTIEDASVALGLMANSGIKASEAGTALRTGLSNLAKPTKQMKEWMDKYNIALVENADGSVDLRGTMELLREKMSGLSETEQAAAASAIFGKNAMSGWLAIVEASEKDFNKLTKAIDNSEGSAKSMADVMQDNLQGSLTEFNSALEGLGIAVFEKISAPLNSVVETATKVLSGLTSVLKGHKSENDIVLDQIVSANKAVQDSLKEAGDIQATAAANAGKIDVLTQALISLNEQDDLDERQKARLKGVYDELVKLVPELAEYYDKETGKVKATAEAIRGMTKARKDDIIEQGRLQALEGLYKTMGETYGNMQLAMANIEGMQKQRDMWVNLRDRIGEAQSELNNTFQDMNKGPDLSALEGLKDELIAIAQEALNSGAITTDTYNQIAEMFDDNWSESELAAAYDTLQRNVEETDVDIKNAEESMGDLQREYDNAEQTVKNLEESINSHTKATREEIGAVDDSSNSIGAMTEEKLALKKATDEGTESTKESKKAVDKETESVKTSGSSWAEYRKARLDAMRATDEDTASTKNNTEAIEEAIKAVHEQADAQKALRDATQQARDDMTKAFEDIKKSTEDAFKVNPFDKWNQDTEKGMLAFEEAMKSQIDGLLMYKDNITTVKDNLGEVAPEFVQYLEDMGQGGAQLVAEFADAFRNGDTEAVYRLMDEYKQALDIQDDVTNILEQDKLALILSLDSLSPEVIRGWEDLGYAFDEGVGVVHAKGKEITQATSDSFWKAVDAAKSVGMEVPKGLADSIRNSEEPEQAVQAATDQINAALRGRGTELLSVAHDLGVPVPPEIANAITSEATTGQDLQNAVGVLAQTLSNESPNMEAAGKEIGQAAGDATSEGIENKKQDVSDSADSVVEAAKESASTASEVFKLVGHSGMEALKGGIREKSQEVGTTVSAVLTIAKNQATNHGNQIFPGLGSDIGTHIIAGLQGKTTEIESAGGSAIQAVANGMNSASWTVSSQAGAIAAEAANKLNITVDAWYAGYNGAIGFGNGIGAGREYVAYCGQSLANAALDAARRALAEASPSKKFYQIGDYAVQGFTNALGDGESDVERAVMDTFGIDGSVADALTDFDGGTINFDTRTKGVSDRMDAMLDVVEMYLPQILEANREKKILEMGDNFMPTIAQKTSETIGRNARRLM